MNKTLRTAGIVVGAVLLLLLAAWIAWQVVSRQAYPQTRGTVQLEGLTAPVDIYRDEFGVPHIYAQTPEDLFFAQGYVHAQDRFWQMEFWRRIGSGRLSEYFGESTLSTDIYMRTLGFARLAERELAASDPQTRAALEAYAAGVNAYVLNRPPGRLGLEFTLLGLQGVEVKIEPWSPLNTLTWAKVMAYDLGGNMDSELFAVDLIQAVGLDMAADYLPPYPYDAHPVIVPDEELEANGLLAGSSLELSDLAVLMSADTTLIGGIDPQQPLALGRGLGIGSNNWVISGNLTDTGMPLLADDMHLGIQMPAIWYEVGLHCVEESPACPYNVRGYSFAGAPGVIVGFNDHIAWGVTNVGPDVQDLYIERVNPANPDQYEVNGEWVDMEIVREEITVAGQDEPVIIEVRSTRHGPIMTDTRSMEASAGFEYRSGLGAAPEDLVPTVLALRWTALEVSSTFRSVLLIDQAQNWEDFREALGYWDVPSQNFVYADREGNIGYQTPGRIPVRLAGDGRLPVPGWVDDYEWAGYIPFDDLPRMFNPEQGYIATANNAVTSQSYPYLISTEFASGYRAERIVEMIESDRDGISMADIQAIHGDNLNLSALEVLPYLADVPLGDSDAMRDWLLAWDGQMDMDSPQAALYGYFWVALLEETFHDQLPEDLTPGGGEGTQSAIYLLLEQPENIWWDDARTVPERESRDDILARAFEKGYAAAVEQLGRQTDRWRWGDVHTATFANQTFGVSGIGIIEAIFNRGPVAVSGDSGRVNNTGWSARNPFVVTSIPSQRMIVDLSDPANSLMVHTTGQSGQPGHPHYDDFIDPWRFIEYHPVNWERAAVEATRQHLVLIPAE